jgi:hypothetical protein
MMAMMITFHRQLGEHPPDRERQFFSSSLQRLSTASGTQVQFENWMITSFEVEFGVEIGSGGW